MKKLLWWVLTTMPFVGFCQAPTDNPRLAGIVDVEDVRLAIIQPSSPPRSEVALREGQREGNLEVFAIDSTNRSVTATVFTNHQRSVLVLTAATLTNHSAPGIVLEEVRLQTVLNLFAEFSDRTILQYPGLLDVRFSLASAVTNRAEAAQILKSALSEKRIAVVPDGPKFLQIVPEEMVSGLKPRAAELAITNTASPTTELIPQGSIVFTAATLPNVLAIYAEFMGGKLDRAIPLLRDGRVIFKMQNALTRQEVLYAFETLLDWQGVKLVPAGDGTFKAIPIVPNRN